MRKIWKHYFRNVLIDCCRILFSLVYMTDPHLYLFWSLQRLLGPVMRKPTELSQLFGCCTWNHSRRSTLLVFGTRESSPSAVKVLTFFAPYHPSLVSSTFKCSFFPHYWRLENPFVFGKIFGVHRKIFFGAVICGKANFEVVIYFYFFQILQFLFNLRIPTNIIIINVNFFSPWKKLY